LDEEKKFQGNIESKFFATVVLCDVLSLSRSLFPSQPQLVHRSEFVNKGYGADVIVSMHTPFLRRTPLVNPSRIASYWFIPGTDRNFVRLDDILHEAA
jgi:hypothetical protein